MTTNALTITCPCGRTHRVESTAPRGDELCDAGDNPLGSEWSFRRLAKEGAFPAFRGPRGKLMARRADVMAYLERRAVVPLDAQGEPDLLAGAIARGELASRAAE
ncbi:MAG: hypothetical protein IT373_11920 [Polyangiaceae bacterium]|nr:hypothetical protein [Polyangiaceae bacterium]